MRSDGPYSPNQKGENAFRRQPGPRLCLSGFSAGEGPDEASEVKYDKDRPFILYASRLIQKGVENPRLRINKHIKYGMTLV